MSRFKWPTLLVLAAAAHVAAMLYFVPAEILFGDRPIAGDDFDTHIHQTWKVLEGLEGWGQSWVYDTQLLAGVPTGTIFDADNKGWTLWTHVLSRLGVPRATAFNMFVLLANALVPLVVYACARLFGLGRPAAVLAAVFGSLAWMFDSFMHWMWWVGMVSYGFAAYLTLLPLALFYRMIADRRVVLAIPVSLGLGLCHLVHPYSFWILVAPMAAIYVRAFRELSRLEHAAIGLAAAFAIAVNAWWISVAFEFWHYILDSAYYGQSGLDYLIADFFGVLRNPSDTGVLATRTGFRFLFFAMAIVTLVLWRRDRDPRVLPIGVGLGATLALAYLGGYLGPIAQVQPYRHVAPALMLSVIPAAALAEELHRRRRLHGLPRLAYAVLGVALIPAAQHLARDVQYFVPLLLPKVPRLIDGSPTGLAASGYPPHLPYQFPHGLLLIPRQEQLLQWVRDVDDGQSRFAVELDWLGERMAWDTEAQVMGGFRERNLQHSHSNLFRRYPIGSIPSAELREYMETYGVRFLIISGVRLADFEDNDVLRLYGKIEPFAAYEARFPVSLVARGGGAIRAATNRLEVTASEPGSDLVLRFHWLETLVCSPDCTIEREPFDGDPVGFIRVPAPHPADLVISNGY